jgi:hypothetical protein
LKQEGTIGLSSLIPNPSPILGEGSLILLHVWFEVFIFFLQAVDIGCDFSFDLMLFGEISATQQSIKTPFSRLREKGWG